MYIGFSVQMGGSSSVACADIRVGLAESKSLRYLNLNHNLNYFNHHHQTDLKYFSDHFIT
jgi:hypothetical protein